MQDLGVFHSLGALWLRVLNELETKGLETVYQTMQVNALADFGNYYKSVVAQV